MGGGTKNNMDSGTKNDLGKNRVDLISPVVLEELGKILTMGAAKYGDRNWEKGIDYNRIYGAALRHLLDFWSGEDLDAESGLLHLSHCLCNLMFLIHYETCPEYEKFDNRP